MAYLKEFDRKGYEKALSEAQYGTNEKKEAWDELVTDTAGFEPLEVKFKRMEQAGYRAQFAESEFTSSDLRDIYLNPDFQITPEDDYEDILAKDEAQRTYVQELLQKKQQYEDDFESPATDDSVAKRKKQESKQTSKAADSAEDDVE